MVLSKAWCTVCCTRHAPGGDCPGSLLATGPERHVRKFAAMTKDKAGEYYGILVLSTVGLVMLAMAGDLVIVFLGIETMSIGVYVLTASRRR